MPGDDYAKMQRALSGDTSDLSRQLTGMDLRLVTDAEPLDILEKLRRRALKRKNKDIHSMLDTYEKRTRSYMYIEWTDIIQDDLSRLGLATGHRESGKVGLDDIL